MVRSQALGVRNRNGINDGMREGSEIQGWYPLHRLLANNFKSWQFRMSQCQKTSASKYHGVSILCIEQLPLEHQCLAQTKFVPVIPHH